MKQCVQHLQAMSEAVEHGRPIPVATREHLAGCPECKRGLEEERQLSEILAYKQSPPPPRVSQALHTRIVDGSMAAIAERNRAVKRDQPFSFAFVIRTSLAAAALLVFLAVVTRLIPEPTPSSPLAEAPRNGLPPSEELLPLVSPLLLKSEEALSSSYRQEMKLIEEDFLAAARFAADILPSGIAVNGS